MSADDFFAKYNRNDMPPVVEWIWPNIHHYLSDADIRAKEPTYREMQDAELGKMIRLLLEDGSEQELRSITFLGPSRA